MFKLPAFIPVMRLASVLSSLAAPLAVYCYPNDVQKRDWNEVTRRADSFTNVRWTFYHTDTVGACGGQIVDSDFKVALAPQQYGSGFPGPNCGRKVILTHEGKAAAAVVADECPSCPDGGLDLTTGLFEFFGPLSSGLINGDWSFED